MLHELLAAPTASSADDRGAAGQPGINGRQRPARGLTRRETENAQSSSRDDEPANRRKAFDQRTNRERHLENVRVKLGVTSRAQIAAWTVEHGPLLPPAALITTIALVEDGYRSLARGGFYACAARPELRG